MATIANWNGHTFEVSPNLIRGFTDFSIKGSCETTTKNSNKQKYEEHKYGESPQIGMTIGLNAMTGVTDVFKEALEFVKEATEGACAYFYMGTKKLIPAKMILVSAEVTQIVHLPGEGCKWISCDVKVSFKQGTKNDETASSSGSSGSSKVSVKKKTTTLTIDVGSKINDILNKAKKASDDKVPDSGLSHALSLNPDKYTIHASDSASKKSATTGKCEITNKKITLVPQAIDISVSPK